MLKSLFGWKTVLISGGLFLLGVGLSTGIFLVTRPASQDIRSKAAASGKVGCNGGTTDVNCPGCAGCTGMPPACTGKNCTGSVTVPGMPDTMNAWGVVNPTYNQPVTCTSRDSQKADCSCQVSGGVPYCWMGLETLVLNGGNQGHRWAMYVYDKATNRLTSGGPTTWVLYDDNPSSSSMWGNSKFLGTSSVLHCGERHEYREQADLYSPGSWIETGQVIYAEPTGCSAPPPSNASCQRVTADKDLTGLKLNDTVTFTGFGATSSAAEKIDQINFIISTPSGEVSNTNVTPSFDGSLWKAIQSLVVRFNDAYTVRIRVHWLKADGTSEWKE